MELPDLFSAHAKIRRAREHMSALECLADRFMKSNPYQLGRRLEAQGRVHEYFFSKYTTPPDTFGLVVGDAIHNLRSALDHVAFALAQHGAEAVGATMTREQAMRIQFPICDDPDDFKIQIRRKRLRYVKSSYKTLIERYQPYNLNRQHPERTVPKVLADLNNRDKHRLIAVLSSVIHWPKPSLPPGIDFPKRHFPPVLVWDAGAVVARFTFAEPQPDVDMNLVPDFSLAIDEAWPPTTKAHEVLEIYAGWIECFITDQIEGGVGAT